MAKTKTQKSTESLLLAEAAKIDPDTVTLTMPLYVLLGEAIDVARFCQHYWKAVIDPKTKQIKRPGLELAGDGRISESIADEILALQDLVQKAQTAYLLAVVPAAESTERAEYVLEEISSALEWVCNDGITDEKDAKLAAIVEAHRDDAESEDALASEIADYLGLAEELDDELASIGSFDAAILDEAKHLVAALRERSALRAQARSGESSTRVQERNQLAALLLARVNRVRAAARYVFRHHDAIVKQVTSAYQRRRRAAARRRAGEEAGNSDAGAHAPLGEDVIVSA